MLEIFSESVSYLNLPFTALLAVVMFYWLLVALGALDSNFGADAHGDFGADGHIDGHNGSANGDVGGGWLSGMVHFINLGEVPVAVVLSIFSLCLWTGSMIANHYFTDHRALLALVSLLPNLAVSTIVTRYLTLPMRPLFRMLREAEGESVPLVGRPCRITTSTANPTFGQAEVATDGAPLLIDVRTLDGVSLPRGTSAVVFREDAERGIYFVVAVPDPQLS